MADPNWAEQVTAISTAVGSIGLLSTVALVILGGRQVREAQQARHVQVAADFLRRWDEGDLVESRRMIDQFNSGDELAAALQQYIADKSVAAYVLYRELDYFEQLGALESLGAFPLELINVLLGRRLVDRWELWRPAIEAIGVDSYPMFAALAGKVRRDLG